MSFSFCLMAKFLGKLPYRYSRSSTLHRHFYLGERSFLSIRTFCYAETRGVSVTLTGLSGLLSKAPVNVQQMRDLSVHEDFRQHQDFFSLDVHSTFFYTFHSFTFAIYFLLLRHSKCK